MSNSYKHNPAGTIAQTRPGEQKEFKRRANRKLRRIVKERLRTGGYLPQLREVASLWGSPGDGKHWYGEYPKWERK